MEDRHPDHGKGAQLAIDACFLSGLRKIETGVPDWEAITVPVDYSSVADAAYVQVQQKFLTA